MRKSTRIVLSEEERTTLESWVKSRRVEVGQAERARIILLAAEGVLTKDISAQLGIPKQRVARWRNRFADFGMRGIQKDAHRNGRTPKLFEEKAELILQTTKTVKPKDAARWTVRTLAAYLNVSPYLVHQVWKRYNLKPHLKKATSFKASQKSSSNVQSKETAFVSLPSSGKDTSINVGQNILSRLFDCVQETFSVYPEQSITITQSAGEISLSATLNVCDDTIHFHYEQKSPLQEKDFFFNQWDRATKWLDQILTETSNPFVLANTELRQTPLSIRTQFHHIPTQEGMLFFADLFLQVETQSSMAKQDLPVFGKN